MIIDNKNSTAEHTTASPTAAPAANVAHQKVHPERKAETSGVSAGLCIRLLIVCVGLSGRLKLVKQILIGIVVGFHRGGYAGLITGADIVAETLIDQGAIIVPLRVALIGGNAVQRIESLLIKTIADIIGCGAQFRAFLAGGVGLAAAGGAVKTKAERSEAEPAERIFLIGAAITALAVAIRIARTLALLLVSGLGAILLAAHDFTVSSLYLLEFFLGRRVIGVQVRMVLLALLAVGFFDCFIVGTGGDAQYAIWIGHW